MTRIFDYEITEKENQKSIQDVLKEKGYSRPILIHLKRTPQSILLNGRWEHTTARVHTGDFLRITLIEAESSPSIVPANLPLAVCYEDEDILVINKPAHMPIHPSKRHPENTLANAVCGYFAAQSIPYTFRCVNRLDCDTTGLVIIAKHMLSASILNADIKKRQIHREYLALAEGCTPAEGTINAPISRNADSDMPYKVNDSVTRSAGSSIARIVDFQNGEHAVTHYKRLAYIRQYSLLSLRLETGRTHQIRVHMNYLGHPLLGDALYNPAYTTADTPAALNMLTRQALHSYRLQFTHPITGVKLDFTAPLPADMAALIAPDTAAYKQFCLSEASCG